MKKPNLFIVGAPKCGTSAMAAYLDQHPEVFVCDPKEPFYWCKDYPALSKRHGIHSLDSYLDLFNDATNDHVCIGEGSTNYLCSMEAIPRVLDFNPDARFVAMLRNPVEVVHAFHAELLFSRIEVEPDFEKAWRLQWNRQVGRSVPPRCEAPRFLQYAEVASFADQIERMFDLVPESQRHVIVFDDFKSQTPRVFKETQEFLGLTPIHKDSFERVNAAHGHRSQLVAKLILDPPPVLRPFVEQMRSWARGHKGGWIYQCKKLMRRPQQRKALTPGFQAELEEFFSPQVRRLTNLLCRNLEGWPGGKYSPPAGVVTKIESGFGV
ncbi:MAG: sulfotransferase [Planctomycetota bacterium]